MRVATYIQQSAVSSGSVLAHLVFTLTVLLGTSAVHTLTTFYTPAYTPAVNGLWMLLYFAAFMALMIDQGINWITWMARYRILLVVLLLGTALSIAWSISALVSAERVVHLIGCSILAIYIGMMLPLLTIMRLLAVVLAVILLACVAAAVALPELGIEDYEGIEVWRGILNSKNMLGFWSAIGVLLYLALIDTLHSFQARAIAFGMAVLSLGLLAMSQSATSVLALLVGGALSFYLFIAQRFQLGFVRMVVLAVLLTGVLAVGISNIDTASIIGRSDDLTGRAEVWRQTWSLILRQPLTGYGYGTIWFPNDDTLYIQQALTDFTWVVYHAHNGFLQVASEIGLPLSCVALLMVVQQLIEVFYCQSQRQQSGVLFVLAFVLAYLVSNFAEARFLVNRELYWILFIALPISMLRQTSLQLTEAEPADDPRSRRDADTRIREDEVPSSESPDVAWPITATGVAANLVQHLSEDARLAYEEDLMRQFAALDLHSAPDIDLGTASTAPKAGTEYPFDEDVTLDISSPLLTPDDIAQTSEHLRARSVVEQEDEGFDPADYGLSEADVTLDAAGDESDSEFVADFPIDDDDTHRQSVDERSVLDDEDSDHEDWLDEASSDLQRQEAGSRTTGRDLSAGHGSRRGTGRSGSRDLDDTFDPDEYGVYQFDQPGRIVESS